MSKRDEAQRLKDNSPILKDVPIEVIEERIAELEYNPNQPRDPKGSDTGGQWKSTKPSDDIKKGSKVKFKTPEEEEKDLVFVVLEDNGDRVLVQAQINTPIKPTFIYLKKDLVPL